MPEIEQAGSAPQPYEPPIAPAWHTVLLILAIIFISIAGKLQLMGMHTPNRLLTYGTTAGIELLMLGWVALGLRLRKLPLRALMGASRKGIRGVALDFGAATLFWVGALMMLGTIGALWTSIEFTISQSRSAHGSAQTAHLSPKNEEALRTLEQLAPENGEEIACWVLLCCFAGTIEEIVFRGYLQRQFTAWAKGGAAWGVAFSALLFGAAHGYQGPRNMILLAVFGALFSGLAIVRRSLRAGIIAHSWHDLIAGLALTFLRAHRLL